MKRLMILLGMATLLVLALGCSPNGMAMGTVQLRLTDAPGDIESAHLVITQVSVHRSGVNDGDDGAEGGGWEVVNDDTTEVDLMTLRDGVFTTLGVALVPAGRYTQIRLKLGEGSRVVVDGVEHPLVIPSGMQSGFKLIHPFTVPPEGFVDLLVDIDAQTAIQQTGSGTWMLAPTAKVTQASP